MLSKSTVPLILAYILLIAAGVLFLNTPPVGLEQARTYDALLVIWSLFYIIGSFVSLIAVMARAGLKIKHITALWYFEVAGLCLIVAANLVYSYALLRVGLYQQENNIIAFSLIISAFAASFIGRIVDVFKLIRVVNIVALDRKDS